MPKGQAFVKILKDNDVTDYQSAIMCDELWDVGNGITLCEVGCHKQGEVNG
jgi:hypothetical protein